MITLALGIGGVAQSRLTILFVSAVGCGIGLAAALLTYRHSSPPDATATDSQRQDSLERLRVWSNFWKYFLVSFALVLITTLLSNMVKERELDLRKLQQESDIQIAETANLEKFTEKALVDDWNKQYLFASYFSHLVQDSHARERWDGWARFILDKHKESAELQKQNNDDSAKLSKLAKQDPSNPEVAGLVSAIADRQTKLEVNKAIIQPQASSFLRIGYSDLLDNGTLFEAGLVPDASGAYHGYHPDGRSGVDDLSAVGKPGNWWGLVTDNGRPSGNPVIQSGSDPALGFYISTTSLQDVSKNTRDPKRYVDSQTISYIAIPPQLLGTPGVKLGDLAAVLNTANQNLSYAIVADIGPHNRIGEGSIALLSSLGIPSSPKTGGIGYGIIYKIFPGSGKGWPVSPDEINVEGRRLLEAWGGKDRLLSATGRSAISSSK